MSAKRLRGFNKQQGSEQKQLVVFLHGWTRTTRDMAPLVSVAENAMPNADIYVPPLPIWSLFSRQEAQRIAQRLTSDIDQLMKNREAHSGKYEEIVLVGHSTGAVLARAVWALSQGGQPNGQIDRNYAKDWTGSISRLVLLAAVN